MFEPLPGPGKPPSSDLLIEPPPFDQGAVRIERSGSRRRAAETGAALALRPGVSGRPDNPPAPTFGDTSSATLGSPAIGPTGQST